MVDHLEVAGMDLPALLDWFRGEGWRVAVHNDYDKDGDEGHVYTFWLFTHKARARFVKGEGTSDLQAVRDAAYAALDLGVYG